MRRAQQSRRPQLYAPNVFCIHLRKIKYLVTKLYASMLPDCWGVPEKWMDTFSNMPSVLWIMLCHHHPLRPWQLFVHLGPAGYIPAVSILLCLCLFPYACLSVYASYVWFCDYSCSSYLFTCSLRILLQIYIDPDWVTQHQRFTIRKWKSSQPTHQT